jgi:hypothetical protein
MKLTWINIRTWLSAITMVFLLVFFGYLRDYLFKSVNALLKAWDYDRDYYLPAPLSFLENYDYNTLVNLKWLMTLIFSLIYLVLCVASLRIVFKSHRYLRLAIFTYVAIIILSGLFILAGMVFSGSSEKMYEFARYIMGMAQSPLILMILIPALKLSEKEKAKSET